ncbi:protein translocase subunit SecD [Desulfohalobium retbaense]|uniref:Protein translocase subunit SecD n=1 Tax=Desulfohalobium retbaense (strain ATCC 49708 / DSM 5692 / JCM 16813 / HR100) TaxID=485915 RepID=C8X140_DESRD|nr:protein translocase subunit SecD [Desulfohalobium retbaense]ACV68137.1 protein-export membrane protein SecD [Desulfohalobium retbaense DSM 5692]
MSSLRWRIVLAVIVLGLGLAYALPSVLPSGSGIQKMLPDKEVNLGLDLKGGMHLTLGVDLETAIQNALSQTGQDIRAEAREESILVLRPEVDKAGNLQFWLAKQEQSETLQALLEDRFPNVSIQGVETLDNGRQKYTVGYRPKYREHLEEMTLDQALKTIRNRVDQFGVAEPDIRKQQGNRIQVQLPGLEDPERAIKIIGQTAHLEFKLVDEDADAQKAERGIVPPGSELAYLQRKMPDGSYKKQPIVLEKNALLTGEYITDASTQFDTSGFNQPYVALSFNQRGSRLFERITAEHVGDRLAIVLDGKVYSAPRIQERISGGRASITGGFTTEEAHDLALVLRAGSLPAPVDVLQERSVGPSLGQQSIDQGIMSIVVGGALVLLFMVIYYGIGGIVADTVLALNILLILAGLAGFGATLTLPGIAGIILTIGMAVDANVLIFERIREELRRGLGPRKAVDEGFARATLTILDANVTTIIAAIILYQFGTGPIRGFAVTLSLGIVASMFTAIFVARIMFDLWLSRKQPASSLKL